MTLTKQLWVAVALVMALAFGCSVVVSVLSARDYLQNALEVKNIDNATSLALSLSQLDKDPVTVELQVAAQFVRHVTGAGPAPAEAAVLRRAYEDVVGAERGA